MSGWETIADQDLLKKMRNKGLVSDIQTLTGQGRDNKARIITAILGSDYVLQIGEGLEEVDDYLDIFIKLFSVLAISLIVVSTLIGWLLAKRATRDMRWKKLQRIVSNLLENAIKYSAENKVDDRPYRFNFLLIL